MIVRGCDSSNLNSATQAPRVFVPKVTHFVLEPTTLRFRSVCGADDALLGYPEEDWLVEGFWMDHIHPEDREAVLGLLKNCSEMNEAHDLEYRMHDRDGGVVRVVQHCELRRVDDDVIAVGFIIDITERAAANSVPDQGDDVREALIRRISREFIQPINAISGYGKMLERHLSSQGDDVGSDYALGVRDGIEQLSDVMLQLRRAAEGCETAIDDLMRTPSSENPEQAGLTDGPERRS